MKVLVTGGSGQLGSYLLEELIKNHEPIGIDLREPSIEEHRPLVSRVDIRDLIGAKKACEGMEVVIHAAAQVSVEKSVLDPRSDADTNIIGTLNMLEASASAGVNKFIYVSSAAVYGDPQYIPVDEDHPKTPKSFYGVSKLAAEHYVRVYGDCRGLGYIIVRPFNFYSPRADPMSPYSGVITKFVQWAREGRPIMIEGDGEQTRDFIHAKDVARMILLAMESSIKDKILNCGSGKGTSINELAATLSSLRGGLKAQHVGPRTGDIRHSVADVKQATEVLGLRPEISIEDGLASFF